MERGKRKKQRPLCTKSPLHLTVKCTKQIYENRELVTGVLKACAVKFGVPVFDFAVATDHIHFVTKVPSREAYVKFIRAFTGILAKRLGTRLIASIFTRIASWGADYWNLIVYCRKNREEAFRNHERGDHFRYYRPKWKYGPKPN